MAATAVLYSKAGCPFCAEAEAVLVAEGISYRVEEVSAEGEARNALAQLTGDPVDELTVPKIVVDGVLVRSSEELRDLRAVSALRHLARNTLLPTAVRQPLAGAATSAEGAVCLLHTGPPTSVWLAELRHRLEARGATVSMVDAERLGGIGLADAVPYAVVVNRVSDAVPPALARFVGSFLAYCETQGVPVVNGAKAYLVASSKIAQHAFFHAQGARTPRSVVVRCAADVDAVASWVEEGTMIFKPNAGSFGKGIVKFDDAEKLRAHSKQPSSYGNDGVALLQRYHDVRQVHRVFVLDGKVQCGVAVAIEPEQFTGMCMASAQKRLRVDGTPSVQSIVVPDDIQQVCSRAFKAAGADVGSIEYLVDADTGEALYYDLNLLSTFPDAGIAGRDCWAELADYVLSRRRSSCSGGGVAAGPVAKRPAAAGKCKAAMVQMTAVNDTAANFEVCVAFVREAATAGCRIVFLPENFSFMGAAPGQAQQIAEALDGPVMSRYLALARQHSTWLSLGGFQERIDGDARIFNTHVVVDDEGRIAAVYRKIHLYDVPMVGLVESRQARAGDALVAADSPAGRLGVTICYDLRFPELYQKLTFLHGAQVLLVPSAFAVKTGSAHWETLLRCRAIECQCYVVAAAQAGLHNTDGNKRRSYGHAMAFDPWGTCIAKFDDGANGTGVVTFEIDLELVQSTRENMPMHLHRRYDIYGGPPHASPELHEEQDLGDCGKLGFG